MNQTVSVVWDNLSSQLSLHVFTFFRAVYLLSDNGKRYFSVEV